MVIWNLRYGSEIRVLKVMSVKFMQVKDLLYFSMRSLIIRISVAQCFKIHEAWYKLLEGPAKVYEKL